jgi:hypothetical protein
MPKVGKKEFPYTVKGKAAAATARKKQMANDKKMKSKKQEGLGIANEEESILGYKEPKENF